MDVTSKQQSRAQTAFSVKQEAGVAVADGWRLEKAETKAAQRSVSAESFALWNCKMA